MEAGRIAKSVDGSDATWTDVASTLSMCAKALPVYSMGSIRLSAGDVLVMHSNLVHAGGPGVKGQTHPRLHLYLASANAEPLDSEVVDKYGSGATYPIEQIGVDFARKFGLVEPK
jgi:hypothetical protein